MYRAYEIYIIFLNYSKFILSQYNQTKCNNTIVFRRCYKYLFLYIHRSTTRNAYMDFWNGGEIYESSDTVSSQQPEC